MPFSIAPQDLKVPSSPLTTEVDKSMIRRFATALGLTNPLYLDEDYARAQGYASLVAPPTFGVTLPHAPIPGLVLPESGILHGEQQFEYVHEIIAGDRITVRAWVESVRKRKGSQGTMNIVTIAQDATNQRGLLTVRFRSVLIVVTEAKEEGR